MHNGSLILAGLAILSLAMTPAPSRAKEQAGKPAKGTPSFTDDMAKLDAVVMLTDEQKKQLPELRQERDAALAKWDESNAAKVEATREKISKLGGSKDAKTRAPLERSLKAMLDGRARLAATHEREMFSLLTKEQRGRWNGTALAKAVTKEFEKLKLTEDQTGRIQEVCRSRGEAMNMPVDAQLHAPLIEALRKQTYAGVLTPAQRGEYDKTRKPAQPAGKAAGTPKTRQDTQKKTR